MALEPVMDLDELWDGEMRGVRVGGENVLLVRLKGQVVAYLDRCVHQAVPMSEGKLDGGILTCPAHGWQYDALTGSGINPSRVQLFKLSLEIREGRIFVDPVPAEASR